MSQNSKTPQYQDPPKDYHIECNRGSNMTTDFGIVVQEKIVPEYRGLNGDQGLGKESNNEIKVSENDEGLSAVESSSDYVVNPDFAKLLMADLELDLHKREMGSLLFDWEILDEGLSADLSKKIENEIHANNMEMDMIIPELVVCQSSFVESRNEKECGEGVSTESNERTGNGMCVSNKNMDRIIPSDLAGGRNNFVENEAQMRAACNAENDVRCEEDTESEDSLDIVLSEDENSVKTDPYKKPVGTIEEVETNDLVNAKHNYQLDEGQEVGKFGCDLPGAGDEDLNNVTGLIDEYQQQASQAMLESLKPISGFIPRGTSTCPEGVIDSRYPLYEKDHVDDQGVGEQQHGGLIPSTALVIATEKKNLRRTKLNFRLPPHKTIIEIDIDALEENSWRHSDVDVSDYFNYGFNADIWKSYCKHVEQLCLVNSVQTQILRGEADVKYAPALLSALGGATTKRVNARDSKLLSKCSGSSEMMPMSTGSKIEVELSSCDRIPSVNARSTWGLRDSDVIIEINFQDSEHDKQKNEPVSLIHKNIDGARFLPFPLDGSGYKYRHDLTTSASTVLDYLKDRRTFGKDARTKRVKEMCSKGIVLDSIKPISKRTMQETERNYEHVHPTSKENCWSENHYTELGPHCQRMNYTSTDACDFLEELWLKKRRDDVHGCAERINSSNKKRVSDRQSDEHTGNSLQWMQRNDQLRLQKHHAHNQSRAVRNGRILFSPGNYSSESKRRNTEVGKQNNKRIKSLRMNCRGTLNSYYKISKARLNEQTDDFVESNLHQYSKTGEDVEKLRKGGERFKLQEEQVEYWKRVVQSESAIPVVVTQDDNDVADSEDEGSVKSDSGLEEGEI